MWPAHLSTSLLSVLLMCSILCDTMKPRSVGNLTSDEKQKTEEANQRYCHRFEIGDTVKQEFYSPMHPDPYTKSTKCTRTIEAPKGELIRIDFRDSFKLEPSENCKYDYLEIRDGPHGYSKLLGRFCGSSFPPMITSSSRHLYLRFYSDDNVEYSGFRAVYSFVSRPPSDPEPDVQDCRFYVSDQEGSVNQSNISKETFLEGIKNNRPIDCMWVINVTKGWKIQLIWSKFKLQLPNDCDSNFVDVFPKETDLLSRIHNFCGSIADNVDSPDNILNIRFVADPKAFNSTFEAFYTAYRDKQRGDEKTCNENEYDCEDGKCIDKALKCNGRVNCRYRWDEDETDCMESADPVSEVLNDKDILIILAIFCIILGGMCVAFLCKIARKLVHDHKVITQNLKASRESRLNELGAAHVDVLNSTMGPIISNSGLPCSSESESSSPNGGAEAADCYVPGEEIISISGGRFSDGACDIHSHVLGPRSSRATIQDYCEEEDGLRMQRNSRLSRDMNPFYEHDGREEFMKDSSCQTRESLFQTELSGGEQNNNSSQSTTPPPTPPLPPSLHQLLPRDLMRHQTPTFSTFAPPPPPEHADGASRRKHTMVPVPTPLAPSISRRENQPHQFQAEAIIEMNNYPASPHEPNDGRNRPYSVQSTKSAPDVIVSH